MLEKSVLILRAVSWHSSCFGILVQSLPPWVRWGKTSGWVGWKTADWPHIKPAQRECGEIRRQEEANGLSVTSGWIHPSKCMDCGFPDGPDFCLSLSIYYSLSNALTCRIKASSSSSACVHSDWLRASSPLLTGECTWRGSHCCRGQPLTAAAETGSQGLKIERKEKEGEIREENITTITRD